MSLLASSLLAIAWSSRQQQSCCHCHRRWHHCTFKLNLALPNLLGVNWLSFTVSFATAILAIWSNKSSQRWFTPDCLYQNCGKSQEKCEVRKNIAESRLACFSLMVEETNQRWWLLMKKEMHFLGQSMRSIKPLNDPHKTQLWKSKCFPNIWTSLIRSIF